MQEGSDHRPPRRLATGSTLDRESWLFVGLIILYLIPVWWYPYFPSQDGPNHVYNAKVLAEYFWQEGSAHRIYLEINPRFDPTWLFSSILSGLMLIVSPLVAEKIIVSLYVIGLPLSIWYFIGAIRPEGRFVALLSFPFVQSLLIHLGFYSYCLGFVLLFFVLGYFWRHLGRWTAGSLAGLAAMSLLLYSLHIITLGVAVLSATVMSIVWLIDQYRSDAERTPIHRHPAFREAVLLPFLAALPTIILILAFLGGRESSFDYHPDAWVRFKYLGRIAGLYSFERPELYLSSAYAFALVALGLPLLRRARHETDGHQHVFLMLTFAAILLFFAVPDLRVTVPGRALGGGSIMERLSLLPWLMFIVWLGAHRHSRRGRIAILVTALVFASVQYLMHFSSYDRLQTQMQEYLSGLEGVEPNGTVMHVNIVNGGEGEGGNALGQRADPFLNLGSHVGTERNVVVLQNLEARLGYFPLVFKPETDPTYRMGRFTANMYGLPIVDLVSYAEEAGHWIDYVMVWMAGDFRRSDDGVRRLYEQLDRHYELIHVSSEGRLEIFEYARNYGDSTGSGSETSVSSTR